MSEETADKSKGREALELFPGEETDDLKLLFSASAAAAEESGGGEEEPALNIALLSKEAGDLKELLRSMSLDDLLDYRERKSEVRRKAAGAQPTAADAQSTGAEPISPPGPERPGEKTADNAEAGAEETPLMTQVGAGLRPAADASYLERDLRLAGTVRARRQGEVFDPPDIEEARPVNKEAAEASEAPPPDSPEALQRRIADYEKGRRKSDSSGLQAVGFVFSFGFTVAAVIFAFWWIAEHLIAWTGWTWLMAPFILVGAVFGLFMGLYMMLPYLRSLDRNKASGRDKSLDKV